jgi:hypothetical protein
MPAKNVSFDNVLDRLHRLSIPEPRSPLSPCTLGAPFTLSNSSSLADLNAADKFESRLPAAINLSPQSSTSSGSDFGSVSSFAHDAFDAFIGSQSRVVRVCSFSHAASI